MKKVTIVVEARATLRKTIEMPDDEAAEFVDADDETLLCNVDDSDISHLDDYEIVDVVMST